MSKPEIIEESPITMSELKSEIERIKKRDEELNFRAQRTEEYLKLFKTLKPKEAKELYEIIEKLNIPRFKDIHITKIVDLMPTKADDVKVILQGYPITVSQENCKKVANAVSDFLKK